MGPAPRRRRDVAPRHGEPGDLTGKLRHCAHPGHRSRGRSRDTSRVDAGLLVDLLVKAAVVVLSLYPLARPGSSHFAGKAMGVRAALYPATTLLIPAVWLLAGRPAPYPILADIALGLPFAIDAGANVVGLFAIKGFDAIPHATGWFFLSIAFGLAVAPLVNERWILFGLVLGF